MTDITKVFLSPHSDDEVLFGSFTIIQNDPIVLICIENSDIHLRELRRQETKNGLNKLGCKSPVLFLRDVESNVSIGYEKFVNITGLEKALKQFYIARSYLEVAYAPLKEYGGNKEHNLIADLADIVFGDIVVHYPTYTWPDGKTKTNQRVACTPDGIERKHRALSCYGSQIQNSATREHFLGDLIEYV